MCKATYRIIKNDKVYRVDVLKIGGVEIDPVELTGEIDNVIVMGRKVNLFVIASSTKGGELGLEVRINGRKKVKPFPIQGNFANGAVTINDNFDF